jgi:hypothetical protein
MNPDRYNIIFGGANGFGVISNDTNNNLSSSASSSMSSLQNSYYCNNNEYIEALAQVANSFLKVLLSQLVEKIMKSLDSSQN